MVREGATTWSFARSCETHSSRVACPSSSASTMCWRPGSSTAGPTPSQACARARTVPSPSCLSRAGAILLSAQEWLKQSCCRSRIDKSNPAPSPGLTAGRVSGKKQEASMPGRWRGRGLLRRAGGAPRRLCQARQAPSRTLAVPQVLAVRAICAIWVSQGKPLNIHSPPGPCYMCYMCYMGLTKQATEHPLSPGSLLYVLYVLYGPI